jgi:hypothetical protein
VGRNQIVDKRCTRCNTYKRLEEFDRKKENKTDGRKSWCKVCSSKHSKRVWMNGKGDRDKAAISASPAKFFNHWLKDIQRPKNIYRHPIDPNLTVPVLLDLFKKQNYKCAKTGVRLTHLKGQGKVDTNVSVDRIDNDLKLYTLSNIQLVCYRYNIMKGDMTEKELDKWCRIILSSSND